jgi:hypothetical protein
MRFNKWKLGEEWSPDDPTFISGVGTPVGQITNGQGGHPRPPPTSRPHLRDTHRCPMNRNDEATRTPQSNKTQSSGHL